MMRSSPLIRRLTAAPFTPYLAAVVLALLTLWLRVLVGAHLEGPSFIVFTVPIILSAYRGGLGPGLAATGVTVLGACYYVLPPLHNFAVASPTQRWQLGFLVFSGVLISTICEALRQARERAEGNQRAAERKGMELQAALQANSESDELVSKAFRLGPDCMVITRLSDGSVIRANDALARLWGSTPGGLIGRPAKEHVVWRDAAAREEFLRRLQEQGECLDREAVLKMSGGREAEFNISSRLITLKGEKCILTVLRDITERRRLETAAMAISAIVESSVDAIVGKTLGSVVTSWNPSAERIFGYTAGEMIGRSITLLIPPDRLDEEAGIMARIARGEHVRHFETVRRTKDGRLVDISVSVSPIKDSQGQVIGASKIARDITEQKKGDRALRATQARLQSTLAAGAIGTWTWEIATDRLMADEFTARAFSVEVAAAAQGLPVTTYLRAVAEEDQPRISAALTQAIETCGTYDVEYRVRRKDGTLVWLQARGRVEGDTAGKAVNFHGAVMDITERKQAEEKIRELNTELEQRVIERTAQLEAANKELEAFSYSVSHDLRAPLRAVDGFSLAVLEDFGPQLPADGQRQLQTIRSAAQRMGELIDDLLTFSRLSRLPLTKQTVKTEPLVRSVLLDLQAQGEGRQIEFKIGDLPPCEVDPALLKQVWVNLLSNALKYSSKRAEAVVEIGCTRQNGEQVYFVRDNGSGFDMKYAHKLFGVFQRLHRAEDYEGTGVGLAIVQRIIQRHGGRVWAKAVVDRGATFYFTLTGEAKP
jgi:PAS domain S-box-containing protein